MVGPSPVSQTEITMSRQHVGNFGAVTYLGMLAAGHFLPCVHTHDVHTHKGFQVERQNDEAPS